MTLAADASSMLLVTKLPPRLVRFFTRFPPRVTQVTIEPPKPASAAASAAASVAAVSGSKKAAAKPNNHDILASHPISDPNYNPFLPWKNPATGRWRGAMYGLRKQADLCKLARTYGVERLLPWSIKMSEVKALRREQLGVRVRGTGVGQKVKGHKWEREMLPKMEKRREAMVNMPELIKEWKTRGHGKGWKKWPK